MHCLYLNLASHAGLLACVGDDTIAASAEIDHRVDDSALVPQVEELLKKADWSYQDLTNIACIIGPGGFTSLRVAVALANTLSHQLNIPSCGVHLSDLYFLRLPSPPAPLPRGEGRLWLHSTKKSELFIRESGSEPRCVTIDELKTILKKGMGWMGELISEQRKIADEAGAREAPLISVTDVLPAFLRKQQYKKEILKPWYGRGW